MPLLVSVPAKKNYKSRLSHYQNDIMHVLIKYRLLLVGILLGGVGGYLYYYFVGCAQGTCLITSKPFNSTVYGGLMGGLLMDMWRVKPYQ